MHEGVVWCVDAVDGWVDEVAFAVVVGAADEEGDLWVVFGGGDC